MATDNTATSLSESIPESDLQNQSAPDACATDGNFEPCPTPLNWKQVVAEFRRSAEPWSVTTDYGLLRGYTFGAGAPLYLLNGLTGNCELYALLAYTLRDHFQTVVYDLPESMVRVPAKNIPQATADCLIAAADNHEHKSFQLFATSFGCMAALITAADHPERIERMLLHAAFARRKLGLFERALAAVLRYSPGEVRHLPLRQTIFQRNHKLWFPPFDYSRCEFLEANTGLSSIGLTSRCAAGVSKFDITERLDAIQVPTTLLLSEGDGPLQTELHSELMARLPQVTEIAIDNCGPAPFVTHPHRCAKIFKNP